MPTLDFIIFKMGAVTAHAFTGFLQRINETIHEIFMKENLANTVSFSAY